MAVRITLDGHDFNIGTPESNGVYWFIKEWDGWDSPPQRQTTAAPQSRHGLVMATNLLGARTIVLTGVCKAPTEATFWDSWYNLQAWTRNLTVKKVLRVYEGVSNYKEIEVLRGAETRCKMIGVGSFEFEISLFAPDPLKYTTGVATTFLAGEQKTITNAGNFPSAKWQLVNSTTGRVQLRKIDTGEVVGTSAATGTTTNPNVRLAPASSVWDALARTVKDSSGTSIYDVVAGTSTWFALEPGVNTIKNEGNTTIVVTHWNGWL